MRRLRGAITGVVLALLMTISVAAAWQAVQVPLPDSVPLGPTELRRWLTEHDLNEESEATKLRLAHGIEGALGRNSDWMRELGAMDATTQQRFEQNLLEVLEYWYLEKMNEYFRLPEDQRIAYLDTEVNKLDRWIKRQGRGRSNFGEALPLVLSGPQIEQIQERIGQNDPELRARSQEFQQAVVNRVFARQLERMTQ